MQLHKVYIENFKGVYKPVVVSFDQQQLTILNGPNGFGKTTIFDVVELCLRGQLQRTMTYNNVTKKNSSHKKPFYQHRHDEDVLIKVWLKDGTSDHVIIKRLDKDSDGKIDNSKAFRPDAWGLLKTYYTDDASNFEQQPNYQEIQEIGQDAIDRLFFEGTQLSLSNLYPLFNYLQQEDNIYFLKKDEDTKKNELTFLFQTQKEAAELEQVTAIHAQIIGVKEALRIRITQLGQVASVNEGAVYYRLFPVQNISFDAEEPFLGVPGDQLTQVFDSFQVAIQQLLEFVRAFDIREYEKQKLKNQLRTVIENPRLLQAIVAQYLLPEDQIGDMRRRLDMNAQYRAYREQLVNFSVNEPILTGLGFNDEFVSGFNELVQRRQRLLEQMGEIGRIIRDLNAAREATMQHFNSLHERQPQPDNCPLCNAEWDSLAFLNESFVDKTQSLNSYHRAQQTEIDAIEQQIRTAYSALVADAIENHLSTAQNTIDPSFFREISERTGSLNAINRFMIILEEQQIDVSRWLLQQPVTLERLDENVNELRRLLEGAANSIQIDESRLMHAALFAQYFEENAELLISEEQLVQKQIYLNEKYNQTRHFSLNILNDRLEKIEQLESRIGNIKNQFSAAIKEYKRIMIEKIKIPFYLYSGKILQHYQQGYGIFVDVKESTNRVRFLTDESTDHDIVHQLSSGQLAVVAIAFCLALNKVYEAPKHFKFLAIDDPVQTLDDLNIHSFIELLRHEFPDYQMIVSTHEEHIANYISYKFGKFQFSCGKLNVQQTFYSVQQDLN